MNLKSDFFAFFLFFFQKIHTTFFFSFRKYESSYQNGIRLKSLISEDETKLNTFSVESLKILLDKRMMFKIYGMLLEKEKEKEKANQEKDKSETNENSHKKPASTTSSEQQLKEKEKEKEDALQKEKELLLSSGRRTSARRREKEERQREEERLEKEREEREEKIKKDKAKEEDDKIITCYKRVPQLTPNCLFSFCFFFYFFHSFFFFFCKSD